MTDHRFAGIQMHGQTEPRIVEFNSPHAFVEHASTLALDPHCDNPPWCGAASGAHAVAKFHAGDATGAEKARELIDQLETAGLISTGTVGLGACVRGFVPLVPAYLLGHPESMLGRVEAQSMLAPLKMYIGLGGGGDITADEIRRRGVVLMALVLALAPVRPLELYAYNLSRHPGSRTPVCQIMRLETRPMDLTTVSHVLSCPTFHRVFGFAVTDHALGRSIADSRPIPYMADVNTQLAVLRIVLGEQGTDTLIIPRFQDGDRRWVRDPLPWLKAELEKHGTAV